MYCRNCHSKLSHDASVCTFCGSEDVVSKELKDMDVTSNGKRTLMSFLIIAVMFSVMAIFSIFYENLPDSVTDNIHIPIIILFFAVLTGLVIHFVRKHFKHNARLTDPTMEKTVGSIVDFKKITGMHDTYYPIIQYEVKGHRYRYVPEYNLGSDPERTIGWIQPGKDIPLYYNIHNPYDVELEDDSRTIEAIVGIMMAVGFFIAIAGATFLIMAKF